jgi:hypothetical protein
MSRHQRRSRSEVPAAMPVDAHESSRETAAEIMEAPAEVGQEIPANDAIQENLLDRLLYKGILPRYAFPTDVASFYVFDPANSKGPYPSFRFAPSQGLAIALSQYAPGKEVWIAGKRYTSGAIYSPVQDERRRAWLSRRLYYECSNCHFALTRELSDGHRGERADCPACGERDSFGEARYWLRPPGFAHPHTWEDGVSPDDQPAKSYATRAKLDADTPPEGATWTAVTSNLRIHSMRTWLLVTNNGPRQEGYTYCIRCGLIEPTATSKGALGRTHPRPYPDDKNPTCDGMPSKGICLGMDFVTDILLFSFKVEPPVHLVPGLLATEVTLRTASEALAKAACQILELEEGEIQADFRAAMSPDGQRGLEAEIYLYDTLPGGAGFTRQAAERVDEILAHAIKIMDQCDCDVSCYKCLRSFKNKFEHDRLDRILGRDFLRLVVNGQLPRLEPKRENQALTAIGEDVVRQSAGKLTVREKEKLMVSGIGQLVVPLLISDSHAGQYAIVITHPLAAGSVSDPALRDLAEFAPIPVSLVHELRARKNLPNVTKEVLYALNIGET